MQRLNADGPAREEHYRYTVNEQIAESRINGILSAHQYSNECVTQAEDRRYEYDTCGRVIKRTEQKRGFRWPADGETVCNACRVEAGAPRHQRGALLVAGDGAAGE